MNCNEVILCFLGPFPSWKFFASEVTWRLRRSDRAMARLPMSRTCCCGCRLRQSDWKLVNLVNIGWCCIYIYIYDYIHKYIFMYIQCFMMFYDYMSLLMFISSYFCLFDLVCIYMMWHIYIYTCIIKLYIYIYTHISVIIRWCN